MTEIDTRSEYRDMIETMADEIESEADDEIHLSELVFDSVDSSRPAMYTDSAIAALKHSENGPEEWKPFVADDSSWQDVVRSMAFTAVRADLWEELDERGIK